MSTYYGQLMEAELAVRGLGPDGKPLQGDPDMHGGHPDASPDPVKPAEGSPLPATNEEEGYHMP